MAGEHSSAAQATMDSIKWHWQHARVGDGHAAAMGRLGFHELTQALVAFPDSTIRPLEEPGAFGNPTPQLVTQEMRPAERPTPKGPDRDPDP